MERYLSKERIGFARYEATDELNRSRYTEFEKTGGLWTYRWGVVGFPPAGEDIGLSETEAIGLVETLIKHEYRLIEKSQVSVTERTKSGAQNLRGWLTNGK